MRVSAVVLLALLLNIAASRSSAGQTMNTGDPVKRGLSERDFPRARQLTPGVYSYEALRAGDPGGKMTTVSLIVITNDGVLVADGQGNAEQTKEMVDWIAKTTTQPIKYVVICSDHGDHTGGNVSFPAGVRYIIHPTSKAILDRSANAPSEARRDGGWKLPADAELVADKKTITMGGEEIQILFLGRSHTGGDLAVYLPRLKILFLSEIYLNRVFPAMRSAYPSEWLKALDRAEAMQADIYIAGHGFTEQGPVSREEIHAYHRALSAVIAEATRLHDAGMPVDEAIAQAHWGEYASWTLASSQGPIAIRKVYEELNGKR